MKAGAVTFMSGLSLLIIACNSTVQDRPSAEAKTEVETEVETAKKKLSDLNATQIQVTKKLIEKRNLLLSMPQDSPPTREISRQLAILNKQAGNLVSQVFAAELGLEAAIDAEAKKRAEEEAAEAEKKAIEDAKKALDELLRSNAPANGANPAAQSVAASGVLRLHPFQIVLDENSGTRSVTGEVENTSTNAVTDVTVVFKLVDDRDESAGTVSDFIARIEGESRWAFKALVLDENATSAKFMELKGDELKGIPALPGSAPDPE